MKADAVRRFRRRARSGEPSLGLWLTLESASPAECAVALGLDWIVIDAEHGHLDWNDVLQHIRATVRSETVTLVRIAELNGALIKRVLDIGADGVVIPWIETPEQLTQAVRWAHYPPYGRRGIGAERATGWGQCIPGHVQEADSQVLVVPLIESVTAGQNIDPLLDVPGVETFFFGPADYSSTAGYPGMWEGPGVADAILEAARHIRGRGKQCGVMITDNADLERRLEQGFRMLGLGTDVGLMLRSLHESLSLVGRDSRILPGLSPEESAADGSINRPLERPPESMRPDRAEVLIRPGEGSRLEIAPGIEFETAVGGGIGARDLTTGTVAFAPGAKLPYHTHPFDESMTLLRGEIEVEIEGRVYNLHRLDNITVPRGTAHAAINRSAERPAVLHIAMATANPTRESATPPAFRRAMADDVHGLVGPEYVTRFELARRHSPGNGARFVDYCNADLLPGAAISGGYGLFTPAGRLPAHLHDFDESICIIEGEATCVVEGRRYRPADGATAFAPRGRVHYFVNESETEMAMIWFYAGPYPERIVVAERCATLEGDPWKE